MIFCNKLERLSLASLFQPSLMFAVKAGAYPSVAPFRWKGLSRVLAYYKNSLLTTVKSFVTFTTGLINLFLIYGFLQ
jgi:hypothetical protein